jgi:hypothetical protein
MIDAVAPFEQTHRAYEEFVDRNPQESIELGVAS